MYYHSPGKVWAKVKKDFRTVKLAIEIWFEELLLVGLLVLMTLVWVSSIQFMAKGLKAATFALMNTPQVPALTEITVEGVIVAMGWK